MGEQSQRLMYFVPKYTHGSLVASNAISPKYPITQSGMTEIQQPVPKPIREAQHCLARHTDLLPLHIISVNAGWDQSIFYTVQA